MPIRTISVGEHDAVLQHLWALDAKDRYLRFGYAASDEQIRRYVEQIQFERDDVFGIFNRRLRLIGLAHLAFSGGDPLQACAEFGVSVLQPVRGRGYGGLLFQRAVLHARNRGVHWLFVHALSENAAMLSIARKAGARVERDGSESDAFLSLPHATLDSQLHQIVEEHVAQTDYRLKAQAKQFWDVLRALQAVHRGVVQQGNDESTPQGPV